MLYIPALVGKLVVIGGSLTLILTYLSPLNQWEAAIVALNVVLLSFRLPETYGNKSAASISSGLAGFLLILLRFTDLFVPVEAIVVAVLSVFVLETNLYYPTLHKTSKP